MSDEQSKQIEFSQSSTLGLFVNFGGHQTNSVLGIEFFRGNTASQAPRSAANKFTSFFLFSLFFVVLLVQHENMQFEQVPLPPIFVVCTEDASAEAATITRHSHGRGCPFVCGCIYEYNRLGRCAIVYD